MGACAAQLPGIENKRALASSNLSERFNGKCIAMSVPEPPHDNAKAESFEEQEQRRLLRVANALRATWRLPVIAAIVIAVLIVPAFVILRVVFSSTTTTFLSRVQFTFGPNSDIARRVGNALIDVSTFDIRYPNDARFTINELLDPAILDQVYNELDLNRLGIRREAFYPAFSIRPFSPTEQELTESYRQLLADRRLLFAERERLEQQLKSRLEAASRGAAELSFTISAPLAPEVGRAIVQRVPRTWAQVAIEKKGVLKLQGFTGMDKVIPEGTLDRQPLPLAILSVLEAGQRLDDRLLELGKVPGIGTSRDGPSGKTFRDLEWEVRELRLFHINPLRAALMTYAFPKNDRELRDILQERINYLGILEANALRQSQAIEEGLARFVDATGGLIRGVPERRGNEQGGVGGTTISQVGENFIDKILALTRVGLYAAQNQAFLAEQTNAQLELNRRASEYHGEQNRWKEMLAALPSEGAAPKQLDEATLTRIAQQLRVAVDETNAKWAALSRMEAEFATNRLSRTAELYVPLFSGTDVIRYNPTFNLGSLVAAMSALFIVFLVFWGIRAVLFMRRKPYPPSRVALRQSPA
jgi:hypothetical protein